jgi:hypothetical protein
LEIPCLNNIIEYGVPKEHTIVFLEVALDGTKMANGWSKDGEGIPEEQIWIVHRDFRLTDSANSGITRKLSSQLISSTGISQFCKAYQESELQPRQPSQ